MAYQIIDTEEVDEPVSIAEQKAYSGIDADYAISDDQVSGFVSAARIMLEQRLNIGLAQRQVKVQWPGDKLDLPLSPTISVTSVTKDGEDIEDTEYTISKYQAKFIYINSVAGPGGLSFFYGTDGSVEISTKAAPANCPMYEVTYQTGYDQLPMLLKQAVQAQADFLLKQRGQPDAEMVVCKAAMLLAKGYSRNLVL